MKTTRQDKRTESIKVQINGIPVTLLFAPEPNREAADFIKKALINAYVIRTA